MDIDKLARQTQALQMGIATLRERAAGLPSEQQALLDEALAELEVALQQLEVAEEEVRQQAEELTAADLALQEEHQRYQELFELAPDGYLVTNTRGVIQQANRGACVLLNAAGEFLRRKPLVLFIARDDQALFLSCLAQVRRGETPSDWTTRLQPHGDALRQVSIRVTVVRERAGEPPAVFWLLRDVTEREQIATEQARLRRQAEAAEAQLRAVLESVPGSIIITDPDGRIGLVNRWAEELFGYTRNELLGQPIEVLLPERFRQSHREHRRGYQAAPRNRPMGIGLELAARRKDGSEFPLEVGLSPVVPSDEHLVVSSHRDVTERRRVEQFLAAVISSVSHDLRTPLTSIKTAVTNLLDETVSWEPAEQHELLQTVDEATDRLTHYISQLLALSRVEGHVLQLRREWHDLAEIVSGVTRALDPTLARVRLRVPDDVPLVHADYLVVEQIISNLLQNALRYSPLDSPVELNVRQEGDAVAVEVADTGPGISPAEAQLVFERFYRGEGTEGGMPGAGLGLAIARGFARAHDGDVTFAPRPGGGSVFTLTLPIEAPTGATS